MDAVTRLADRRPFGFILLTLLAWITASALIIVAAANLLKTPLGNPFIQLAGSLSATGLLLLAASRLGWLRNLGLTRMGSWPAWALTLLLAIFLVLTDLYAFVGKSDFDLRAVVNHPEARVILIHTPLAGLVEEILFRGFLLYALLRVWGKTRQGLIASLLVQAALFGVLHALQMLAGTPPTAAIANVFGTFIFGVWAGALVLIARSLWPAILLHTLSNAALLLKGLTSPWVSPAYRGYLQAALFELPLALLGLWAVLKILPAQTPASPAGQPASESVSQQPEPRSAGS